MSFPSDGYLKNGVLAGQTSNMSITLKTRWMKELPMEMNNRNNSIEIMRLLAAILIVAIHTAPLYELNETAGFIATEVITRTAVPFFFLTSGYFFFKSKKSFGMQLLQYLIPYLAISLVYFSCDFVISCAGEFNLNLLIKYLDRKKLSFLIFGSWYHLWFFPAVISALCVFSIANKLNQTRVLASISIMLYIIGVLCCAYQKCFISIAHIQKVVTNPYFEAFRRIVLMGWPFFGLGYFLDYGKTIVSRYTHSMRSRFLLLILIILLWLVEILVVLRLGCYDNVALTFFLYPLVGYIMILLLLYPNAKYSRMGGWSNITSKYMYFFHPLLFLLLPRLKDIPNTIAFLFTVVLFCGTGLLIYLCKQMMRSNVEKT